MNRITYILYLSLSAIFFLFSVGANAQADRTIQGSVTDSQGNPLIGVGVMIENTMVGTVTDIDGHYTLSIPKGHATPVRLTVAFLSYKTVTVEVGQSNVYDVIMQEDTELLEEVVVVGYGAMKRSDLTGSVSSVKIDEDNAAQNASLDNLLRGNAAGVQVVSNSASPDAGLNVVIRGASSFNSNSQPLYVVDGIILNTDTDVTLSSNAGQKAGADEETNGLLGINPQDIASMEILKDASATAIYGSQGANGVVLITTKSARKNKPVISFSAGVDISTRYKKKEMLSFSEFTDFLDKIGVAPDDEVYQRFTTKVEQGIYEPIDWQDYTMRTGVSQRYYFSVAGRSTDMNYRLSMGYRDSEGVIRNTGFSNLTVRLNMEKTIGRVLFGTKTSISHLSSQLTQGASYGAQDAAASMMRSMISTLPINYISKKDADGTEVDDPDAPLSGPERWLSDFDSRRTEFRVSPSLYAQVEILPFLKFKSTFGADYRATEQGKFKSKRINNTSEGSVGAQVQTDRLNWNWDNLLLVDKKFGRHTISGTLGQSASSYYTSIESVEGTNIDQWKSKLESLNSAPYVWLSYSERHNQLLSFFARAVYNYSERYIVTATYRIDGSSKFYGKNKWAQFPSFAFAWRVNQEPWFYAPVISSMKLRLGWGMVGNQGIPSYQTMYIYDIDTYPNHNNPNNKLPVTYTQNLPNRNLKWETTTQYNVGLDLSLWQSRLAMSVDAYYKKTDDLLQRKVMAASAGVSDPYVNMGCIENKGIELTVDAVPVATKNFEWSISGNISFNRNKILSIDPSGLSSGYIYIDSDEPVKHVEYFTGSTLSSTTVCRDYVNVFIAGQPMALFYGMPSDGLVGVGQQGIPLESSPDEVRSEGSINYIDTNKDGVISSADRCIIGDPNPDFTYGFNTHLSFYRFKVAMDFVGSYGNDIYNLNEMNDSNVTSYTNNKLRAAVYDAWTLDNTDARYPGLKALSASDLNWASDRFVEDGSYLRLSNISVSYSVPLPKKSILRGLNIGFSAKNVYVWTKYSGWDPEVNSFGTVMRKAVDVGSYPGARTYMCDVRFTF